MIRLFSNQNIKEQADRLIDSFRYSFWVDEHQWFVRCHTRDYFIHLETLPSSSCDWNITLSDFLHSTIPQDYQQKCYHNMTRIFDEKFFDQPIPSYIHMPNIEYLHIKLPINDQFWSIVPSLNRLRSLTVSSHGDTFHSQVQTLLDRAPHLHALTINQDKSLPLEMSLFKYSKTSVRELSLDKCQHYFNEEECNLLSPSSLGVQCEVLFILVDNREFIINLVKNMVSLRILIIVWNDERNSKDLRLTNINDEYHNRKTQISNQLVQWLKNHLPWTYVVVSYSQYKHNSSKRIEQRKER
ncbi:unnamed protein product [Rotaria sordida]|uniref:Uncharacterized protein n=1 Tax=Rotaria sordida TaxID=392033 RepID=A0A814JP84_9BILA|nr:unnamed protein product [Rotaria sordida]CAF0976454.1 unnamed protein product [Rotaria sordida]CAF1040475.1 unnamed protein product [Rotaria sordida]CAF3784134.1 unnamed protein product [Rotaria sordida]